MKLILAGGLLLLTALPAWSQGADVFVKGDTEHCYDDTAQVVYRLARDVTEQKQLSTIRAGHFSNAAGDLYYSIQALKETNKKGEEGCHIYVKIEGGSSLNVRGQKANDFASLQRFANTLAADVAAMQKDRDKKGKDQNTDQNKGQDKDKKAANPQ
jgi:hypothetical protein